MSWNAAELDPQYPFDLFAAKFDLDKAHTALVVIDMQADYLKIAEDSPIGEKYPDIRNYFNTRIDEIVMPNTVKLIRNFRERNLKIAYTRNGCMTSLGDEMSARIRALNSPPKLWRGTPRYEIAEAILFLSDPRHDYMTGATLLVDGGISLPWWANRGSAAPE